LTNNIGHQPSSTADEPIVLDQETSTKNDYYLV
jgi:hypothetical protein